MTVDCIAEECRKAGGELTRAWLLTSKKKKAKVTYYKYYVDRRTGAYYLVSIISTFADRQPHPITITTRLYYENNPYAQVDYRSKSFVSDTKRLLAVELIRNTDLNGLEQATSFRTKKWEIRYHLKTRFV